MKTVEVRDAEDTGPMRGANMGDGVSADFSVTENTTPHLDFAQDLDAYVAGGADGIGIFEIKLTDDAPNRELLVASGLRASSGFLATGSILPGPLAPGPDDPSERVRDLAAGIRRLAALGAPFCLLSTGPSGGHDATEATSIVVRGLRDLARVASDEGVGIVLELMHPSLAQVFGFVHTLPEAAELLDQVGSSDLGVAIDLWQVGDRPELIDELRTYGGIIRTVHLCDRPAVVRSWCDRVLPGDGIVDLAEVLKALMDVGYDGWFEFEILSDDGTCMEAFPDSLWRLNPVELIREGRLRFLSAWQQMQGT
jgi:sugar phosphate isomerase/epimerase